MIRGVSLLGCCGLLFTIIGTVVTQEAEIILTQSREPECLNKRSTYVCYSYGTNLIWEVNNTIVANYGQNETCGDYRKYTNSNFSEIPEDIVVGIVLSRADRIEGSKFAICSSILEVNSTNSSSTAVNITCRVLGIGAEKVETKKYIIEDPNLSTNWTVEFISCNAKLCFYNLSRGLTSEVNSMDNNILSYVLSINSTKMEGVFNPSQDHDIIAADKSTDLIGRNGTLLITAKCGSDNFTVFVNSGISLAKFAFGYVHYIMWTLAIVLYCT